MPFPSKLLLPEDLAGNTRLFYTHIRARSRSWRSYSDWSGAITSRCDNGEAGNGEYCHTE